MATTDNTPASVLLMDYLDTQLIVQLSKHWITVIEQTDSKVKIMLYEKET